MCVWVCMYVCVCKTRKTYLYQIISKNKPYNFCLCTFTLLNFSLEI